MSRLHAIHHVCVSQASSRDKVVLYYGVRNAEHMAYADQLDAWRQAGVEVVPVLSEEGKGYVQDVFIAVRASPRHTCMCLVHGAPMMHHHRQGRLPTQGRWQLCCAAIKTCALPSRST